ncbi:hypothetical protein [Aeromonas salmonicida]|uniref:hypothetical protein n=1 Tax=Aeromonas salmonicida TaxID=645 RepID=UPI0024A9FB9E|nr:hypothetical protein [Aeromonas salmonicida]MDM5135027.1 hypothetical protein [Aeromonas salmonicida]WHF41141.1 hypothetical protein QJ050_20950 [Aeromonas salmonicida]
MALPWLIGAAVVGAVSYAAKKMKEEEEEREWEERQERRREREAQERAEQDRQTKALQEQKLAIFKAFVAQGEEYAHDFEQLLDGLVEVTYTQTPAFCANLLKGGRNISVPFINAYKLGFLDKVTQGSLAQFETLYQVELHPDAAIYDAHSQINNAEEVLGKLQSVRQQLEHKRNQLCKR